MNKSAIQLNYDEAKITGYELANEGYIFGLFIIIGLETGLRSADILNLEKSNFISDGGKYLIKFTAQKNKKKAIRPISKYTFQKAMEQPKNIIFYNEKYKCKYSHIWTSRNMKQWFSNYIGKAKANDKNVSAHSLRKSAGCKVYQKYGIEGARDFLQHDSYDTTKNYLQITETELNEKIKDALCL
jgi:integrase